VNERQQQTLERVFEKPDRSDIAWSDIEGLIKALGGKISEGMGSGVRVALRDVKAVFHRPHPQRATNKGALRSLRRFLLEAGVKP
jgi:hypothetical protein